jgi:nucleotide-binding universal stress UspA family protein
VELSDKDLRAVEAARAVARANAEGDTEVALLHVIETLDLPFEELEDFYGKLEARAAAVLSELSAAFSPDGIDVVQRIAFGSRVPEILAYAEEHGADLIVLVARPVDPSDPGAAWSGIAYQVSILAGPSVLLLK